MQRLSNQRNVEKLPIHYEPEDLVIDEMMISFGGYLSFQQYLPEKNYRCKNVLALIYRWHHSNGRTSTSYVNSQFLSFSQQILVFVQHEL